MIDYLLVNNTYRTLRGRDQREKCTLNVVKYTFQVKCTLLTTPRALQQANSPRRTASTTNHPAGAG